MLNNNKIELIEIRRLIEVFFKELTDWYYDQPQELYEEKRPLFHTLANNITCLISLSDPDIFYNISLSDAKQAISKSFAAINAFELPDNFQKKFLDWYTQLSLFCNNDDISDTQIEDNLIEVYKKNGLIFEKSFTYWNLESLNKTICKEIEKDPNKYKFPYPFIIFKNRDFSYAIRFFAKPQKDKCYHSLLSKGIDATHIIEAGELSMLNDIAIPKLLGWNKTGTFYQQILENRKNNNNFADNAITSSLFDNFWNYATAEKRGITSLCQLAKEKAPTHRLPEILLTSLISKNSH